MNPIHNEKFSDDFHKFVLQDDKIANPNLNPAIERPKPFDINMGKTKKAKKDSEKEKQDKNKGKKS